MRKQIIAGNWKMNKTIEQGHTLVNEVLELTTNLPATAEVVLGVPFIHLAGVAKQVKSNPRFSVAAQDCHHEQEGAYTGDVSARLIASTGARYVIIGHSERRQYHGEDSPLLLLKIKAALAEGLTVIFCCGETKDIREAGRQDVFVRGQLGDTVLMLSEAEFKSIVIAYEPVWAIGTGLTATPEMAQQMHHAIREAVAQKFGNETAQNTSILYGGSMKASNAADLLGQADIDGGLIGGASLVSKDFTDIIKAA